MTGVIYARYSSDNQREESIEGQIRENQAFAEKNVSAEILRDDTPVKLGGKGLYLGTYAAARGLSFPLVFLPELSADRIPDPAQRICVLNEADAAEYERRLLYLAAGRASGALMLSCAGTPSPLLPACLRSGGA